MVIHRLADHKMLKAVSSSLRSAQKERTARKDFIRTALTMACSCSLMPWGFWPGIPAPIEPMGRPPGSMPGRLLIVAMFGWWVDVRCGARDGGTVDLRRPENFWVLGDAPLLGSRSLPSWREWHGSALRLPGDFDNLTRRTSAIRPKTLADTYFPAFDWGRSSRQGNNQSLFHIPPKGQLLGQRTNLFRLI